MKKKIIKTFIILCVLSIVTGCKNYKEPDNYDLKIIAQEWTGWSEKQPEEEVFYYDVKLNEKYVVKKGGLGLTFTIKKVNRNSIVIETTDSVSSNEKGVDLYSNKKKFTIKKGKELVLTTPTMDAGCSYTFILK